MKIRMSRVRKRLEKTKVCKGPRKEKKNRWNNHTTLLVLEIIKHYLLVWTHDEGHI